MQKLFPQAKFARFATLALAVLLALGNQVGLAQEMDTDLYDGKWTAQVQVGAGQFRSARLQIANFAGTWLDLPGKNHKPAKACSGKKFPITVQRSVSTAMEFTVWGSSVSPACPDLSLDLKPIDAKTLEGQIGADVKVKLTRR